MRLRGGSWAFDRSGFRPGMGGLGYVGGGWGVKQPGASRYDWDIGDWKTDLKTAVSGKASELTKGATTQISDQLDRVEMALKISTAASVVAALIALVRCFNGRRTPTRTNPRRRRRRR